MKTLNLVSAVCVAILLVAPAFVQAQDFRSPYGGPEANTNQARSFFGLRSEERRVGKECA